MKTKKAILSVFAAAIIIAALSSVAYAALLLFAFDSETSQNPKEDYFRVKLTTGMVLTDMAPGGQFAAEPVVTNDATKDMYVFVTVETPVVDNASIYDYTVGEGWELVESTAEKAVYAYANAGEMTTLSIDESTTALTTQMTMKDISNSAFVELDDINVKITGYGIGTEDASTVPSEAWVYCKQVGNIE